jgi:hypothetical protein
MIVCLQWEGRSYTEQNLRVDLTICKELFGVNTPIKVIGFDGGELITSDEVPDFTKVLRMRGGRVMGTEYNVGRDGLPGATYEDWTDAPRMTDDVTWDRLQDVKRWERHASLPHFLWWLMEIDSIMQQR